MSNFSDIAVVELLSKFFYRQDAIPVIQPTASKHWTVR